MADNKLAPQSKNKLPWYEQALPMEGRATFLPFQDTLPGSVMNQRSFALPAVVAGAVNAFTAPGRAYSGSDPTFNPEEEAANFVMNMLGGGMGASRAAPAPAGSLGMHTWHGSPHRFPPTAKNPLGEFDPMKIGTGEGAQAYGHGLYLAENPGIAKYYQQKLASFDEGLFGPIMRKHDIPGDIAPDMNNVDFAKQLLSKYGNKLNAAEKQALQDSVRSNLYKVDLPDEQIAKMLDWDKPFSNQSPDVQELIKNALEIRKKQTGGYGLFDSLEKSSIKDLIATIGEQRLQQAGIPGIRYLDQGSRAGGAGTSNFVVFDPKHMNIIGRE
jgi:hypothetical protein